MRVRQKVFGIHLMLLLGLGLISVGELKAEKQRLSTPPKDVLQIVQDNNARLRYLTSQLLQVRNQNDEIIALLKSSNQTLHPDLDLHLTQMKNQLEELRIQIQVLTKALIVLLCIFLFLLIFMFYRSRRQSRYRSLRF